VVLPLTLRVRLTPVAGSGSSAVSPADDRDAIADLLFEYCSRIDAGDLAGVGALFAHATYRTFGSPVVLRGASEVQAAQETVVKLYDGSPRTHHVVTNVRVVVAADGAAATAASYFAVVWAAPDGPPGIILTGRYEDTLEKADGAWRFTDRLIHLDQIGDLSGHLHLDRVQLG
jgi:3-phenylpropionate/cinnamic acid dioxygenase small subunit